jgi:hypothetical protein
MSFEIVKSKKAGYVAASFVGEDGKELFRTKEVKGKGDALRPTLDAIVNAVRGPKHLNTLKNTITVVDKTTKKVDDKHTTYSI